MDRNQFLSTVRTAAASGLRYRIHAAAEVSYDDCRAEVAGNLVAKYAEEVAKAGGRPVVVDSWSAARDELAKLLRQYEPRSALCWRHPVLDRLGLREFLKTEGIELVDQQSLALLSREAQRAKILACDIGITSCTAAVAETASLFMAHDIGNERVASLAPPVYFAIVERSQIVPDLLDAFTPYVGEQPEDLPSNLTFITGPSKTGDIETKLVTGVHGPGKWHVLIVDAG